MNLHAHHDPRVRLQVATVHLKRMRAAKSKLMREWNVLDSSDSWTVLKMKNRLQAITNHIASWENYIQEGCPRERRAQITPYSYPETRNAL